MQPSTTGKGAGRGPGHWGPYKAKSPETDTQEGGGNPRPEAGQGAGGVLGGAVARLLHEAGQEGTWPR